MDKEIRPKAHSLPGPCSDGPKGHLQAHLNSRPRLGDLTRVASSGAAHSAPLEAGHGATTLLSCWVRAPSLQATVQGSARCLNFDAQLAVPVSIQGQVAVHAAPTGERGGKVGPRPGTGGAGPAGQSAHALQDQRHLCHGGHRVRGLGGSSGQPPACGSRVQGLGIELKGLSFRA